MSLLIDVFVRFEKLKYCLEDLRDEMVKRPDHFYYSELYQARRHARRLDEELRFVQQLLPRAIFADPIAEPPSPSPSPPPPKPTIKLVS